MRKKFIVWLFYRTQAVYLRFKKKRSWNISRGELLTLPRESLGYQLGKFLKENNFCLIPKAEIHDVYHVLLSYGVKVEDEIALQFACFGNGKRSLFLFFSITAGLFLLPEHYRYYWISYQLGKECNKFYNLNYRKLLSVPISQLQKKILITNTINTNQWKSYLPKMENLADGLKRQ